MKNKQGFSGLASIIIIAVLAIGGYFVYKNQVVAPVDDSLSTPASPAGGPSVDTTDWKTLTNQSTGVSLKYPPTVKLDGPKPYIVLGFANSPTLISSRLGTAGYQTKPSYNNFIDLINDIKSKPTNSIIKIIGEVMIGEKKGYEISWNDKSGAWLIDGENLYAFYFDKTEKLSELDKQILLTVTLSDTRQVSTGTENWKTYRNDKYGFEFQYPNNWYLIPQEIALEKWRGITKPESLIIVVSEITPVKFKESTGEGSLMATRSMSVIVDSGMKDQFVSEWSDFEISGMGRLATFLGKPLLINFIGFENNVNDQKVSDQILSTFKFTK